jgi:hypothetical protein
MWKKYACAEYFPELKKLDEESIDIISRISSNKVLYTGLKIILTFTGISFGTIGQVAKGGYFLFALINPDFEMKKDHKKLFNLFTALTSMLGAVSINLVDLDNKIKRINPKSNFIKEILNIRFNGDFQEFEDTCDRIFNKETYDYVAEDFIALICILYNSFASTRYKDKKGRPKGQSYIDKNMGLLKTISPYGGIQDPKTGEWKYPDYKSNLEMYKYQQTVGSTRIKEIEDAQADTKDPKHDLYKSVKIINKSKGLIEWQLSMNNIYNIRQGKDIPIELHNKMMLIERQYSDESLQKNLGKVYDVTEVSGSKIEVDKAWKKYFEYAKKRAGKGSIADLKELRNDTLSAPEAAFLKSTVISPYVNFEKGDIVRTRKNNKIYSKVKEIYNPMITVLYKRTRPLSQSEQNKTRISDTDKDNVTRYYRLLKELDTFKAARVSLLKQKEVARSIELHNLILSQGVSDEQIRLNVAQIQGLNVRLRNELTRYRLLLENINTIDNEISRTDNAIKIHETRGSARFHEIIGVYSPSIVDLDKAGYSPTRRDNIIELQYLSDYYDSVHRYNTKIGNKDIEISKWKADVHSTMNYDKRQQEVYDNYYRQKDVQLVKNLEITVLMGTLWAMYPTLKFFLKLSGKGFNSVIFNPERSTRLFDELLGIIAGVTLGPTFLAKNIITNKDMVRKYAKEVYNIDDLQDDDPMLQDIISDMILRMKEEKKYKKYDKDKKEDKDFNILIDRQDVKQVKHDYDMMKERIEFDRKQKEIEKKKREESKRLERRKRVFGNTKRKEVYETYSPKEVYGDIEISKKHSRRLVKNIIKQKQNMQINKKEFKEEFDKDNFLRGSYAGMIINNSYKIKLAKTKTMEQRVKKKIHRLLCQLSAKTKDAGRIFSQTMTLTMAGTYLIGKLSGIVINHYTQYRIQGDTIDDLCKFVMPAYRLPFKKRKIEKISLRRM